MAKSLKYWASCGVVKAVSKVFLGDTRLYITDIEDRYEIQREEKRMTEMFWANPSYRILVIWKLINEAFHKPINIYNLVDEHRETNLYCLQELFSGLAGLDEVVSDDEMAYLEGKVARARTTVTKIGCNRLREYVPRLRQIISEDKWKSYFLKRVEARKLFTMSNDVFWGPSACGRGRWEMDDGPTI